MQPLLGITTNVEMLNLHVFPFPSQNLKLLSKSREIMRVNGNKANV